jgi:YCII-related domain-containing protein
MANDDVRGGPATRKPFLLRLIAPRATFAADMTREEAALMQEHGNYWRRKLAEGVAVAFGPVLDPAGAWGLGLLRVTDEAEIRSFTAEDPVIRADRGFRYEVLPMQALVS